MMLECSVFIEDNIAPRNSFKRFLLSNIHLGLLDESSRKAIKEPYLCVVTSTRIFKYKVLNNVKRVIVKEVHRGKICIEFSHPAHSILIRCNNDKLPKFLRSFENISDKTKLTQSKKIPIISANLKLVAKSDSNIQENNVKNIIFTIPCPRLRNELLKSIHVLNLPHSNLRNLPVQLGLFKWSEINLENNNLCFNDLRWLEELPIRQTLASLNLSKNKITSFPTALVDYDCLILLNLSENQINFIPGEIGCLQSLRVLNLSSNNIRYLPASITHLKLDELDLTLNYLNCNHPIKELPVERENSKAYISLENLAAMKINSTLRRQLTIRDCPLQLLEKLRYSSLCVCHRRTQPSAVTQYYVVLKSVKFSTSYSIYPQKTNDLTGENGIFLQYHFCIYPNRCENKKFRLMQSQNACFALA